MSLTSLFTFSLLLLLCSVSALPGGWTPIPDIKSAEVRQAAEFAVAEHNKAEKSRLGFESVVSGDQQVVSGINYRLVIATRDDGGAEGEYEAVVWVKPWAHFMSLTSFRKLRA